LKRPLFLRLSKSQHRRIRSRTSFQNSLLLPGLHGRSRLFWNEVLDLILLCWLFDSLRNNGRFNYSKVETVETDVVATPEPTTSAEEPQTVPEISDVNASVLGRSFVRNGSSGLFLLSLRLGWCRGLNVSSGLVLALLALPLPPSLARAWLLLLTRSRRLHRRPRIVRNGSSGLFLLSLRLGWCRGLNVSSGGLNRLLHIGNRGTLEGRNCRDRRCGYS
jgi:hypothetical protein